ncbi:hypothetical protein DNTS_027273, partial [Danionella cerebrum]
NRLTLDRAKSQKLQRSPSSAPINSEESSDVKPDIVKVLDEALSTASANLNQLDALHKTFINGINALRKKEKNRITLEINEAVEKAKMILTKRQSILMSEMNTLDDLFLEGQKQCKRIEERVKELHTAIQKARHVRQVPSLETYCDLNKILEILQLPVDLESCDISSLGLRSGMSIVEEITVEPFQSVKSSAELWDSLDLDNPVVENAAPIPKDLSTQSPKFMEKKRNNLSAETEEGYATFPEPRRQDKYKRKHHRQPCEKPSMHYVLMTHIVNPGHFYVRYLKEQKLGHKLNKQISEFCSRDSSLFTFTDEVKEGSVLFVHWKEDVWCRVKVTELFQKGCLQSVTKCCAAEVTRLCVYFLDYGFSKCLSIASDLDLSGLNECLRKPDVVTLVEMSNWAPLAVRCSLKDIVPMDLVKGWSLEASDLMRNLLHNEIAEIQVFGGDGDVLLVDLKKTAADLNKRSFVSLRDHLVFMELARFYSPIISPGSAPLLFYPAFQPAIDVELNAIVSHVNTPSDFYVQLVENTEFLLLHAKLQDCYNGPKASSEFQIYCPSISQACVAQYEQEWCRVQVMGFPGGRMVDVRYVDMGYRQTISVKDLRSIKDEFFALPEMALWCRLCDVVSSQKTWTDEACEMFRKLVDCKLLTFVLKKNVPSSRPLPVCLLERSDDSPGINIGDILVKNSLALHCNRTQIKDSHLKEPTAWDPPFEEEAVSVVTAASEELKASLGFPHDLKDVRVRITQVTSPGNIYVQLLQFDNQLNRLHDMLKNLFSKTEPQEMHWEVDMYCAANNMGVWERGRLCNVTASGVAELLRCDFGNKVKLHVDNLRPLPSDLVGSSLFQPAGGLSTWTATACDFISHYLTGAIASITIEDPSAIPVSVSLFCSNRAGQNVNFGDFLIMCELDRLREHLQQHIKTMPRQKNYNWKGVVGCAVMGPDMFWYRAQVQEVIGGNVKVQYVDQGLVESIPVCHVYPKVLCEDVPQLCMPCQINGVIPIGKRWPWDAVLLMKELLLGRSVSVLIMEHPKEPSGCVTVEIILDGMPLSKIMVHHQYATFDPTISKQDYVVNTPVMDVDLWDLNTEGLKKLQPVLGVYKELQIPQQIKHFSAKVKHIQTPNEVFLCVLDKWSQEQEEGMEEILEQVNEDVESLIQLTDFPNESPCLAEYSDGRYYRAKLLGFSEITPSVKLLVRHVDFGSDDNLPLSKLRQLPASLHHFPCAAVHAKLAGFKPPTVSSQLERIPYAQQWSIKGMLEMIDLLNGELTAVVTAPGPPLTVLLYNSDGTLVHTPLVEKGLADYD